MVKNEKRAYLEEWVRYHRHLGIEHFTFYNNGDPIAELPHSTIINWPGRSQEYPQRTDYYNNHKNNALWTAMIDLDEFIVPHKWNTLPEMLVEYEQFGGLVVNWLIFGTNDAPDDDRPQTVKFTRRSTPSYSVNKHVKTIGQFARLRGPISNSHYFSYLPPYRAVTPDFQFVEGPFVDCKIDKVQLNHYWFRSAPEFTRKVARGRTDGLGEISKDFWQHIPQCNEVEDLKAKEIWESIP
jgi:hypothetical protein